MCSSEGRPNVGMQDLFIYASLVFAQIAFAVIGVLMGNELSKGTNPLVFVAYSNAFGALVLSPFAFFIEKKKRSKFSFTLLVQVILLSLGGVSAFQALLLMGLKETSPSFASAMPNLAPAFIFVMAWSWGMEKVDMKCNHSRLKILGTVICVGGAMAMSFLHGPAISQLWPSPYSAPSQDIVHGFLHEGNSDTKITGCIYLLSAVIILSSAMILQAETLKNYPAPLSLTVITSVLGSIQTATLITILDGGFHRPSWYLDWSAIITILFGGIVCNAIAFTLQLWCLQKKGPVFVAIFNPVSTVCSAILSSIFLDETMHLGSLMGVLLIFAGLYIVLWGKSKEGFREKILEEEEEQEADDAEVDRPYEAIVDVKIT